MRVVLVLAVLLSVSVLCGAMSPMLPRVVGMGEEGEWVRVPGGSIIHRSCIHEVHDGMLVGEDSIPKCNLLYPQQPNIQIYSIDTHWTTTDTIMTSFNASFNTPGNPPRAAGQINYFWPGFKSTEPTMGLPVIQPVLQYGTGNEWVVRSWYVFGNQGEAVVSPPISIHPGDITYSYMKYDAPTQTWTIFANNTKSAKTTTLHVTKAKMHNVDYKVAMLVLETIMPPNDCKQLPANPSTITFTGITVNGRADVPWVPRTGMKDCNQKVASFTKDVTFSWTN